MFKNAKSPIHPYTNFEENNNVKQSIAADWITQSAKGKRVLDLFSGNGGFAAIAAMAGAKEVVCVEFAEDRLKCGEFVASVLPPHCKVEFKLGDVYKLRDYYTEPFDVVLCLGGLYHVADSAFVLKEVCALTKERLILQTAMC